MCAKIIPFKAIRPARDKAHLVATRPYYSYTKQILKAKLIHNPYSFIHIINPEFRKADKTEPNTIGRFEKVRDKFNQFRDEGIFIQDEKPSFYLYRQSANDHEFVGLIVGASIDEYNKGEIKIHEETISAREETFKMYLDVCGFNAEPVLLAYKENREIMQLQKGLMSKRPEYEYTSTDTLKHELWVIDQPDLVQELAHQFETVKNLYIADGHHRCASSALLGNERLVENNFLNEKLSSSYFMAYLIPEGSLKIYDFNRLVSDLNNRSAEEIIVMLEDSFEVSLMKKEFRPTKKHEFAMYLHSKWYKLNLIQLPTSDNPTDHLDPRILSKLILHPILGIKDLKTDSRISFLNGKTGMKGLQKKVDSGLAKIAFGLYPVSVRDLMHVADTNNIMPPKSTYIEPKLRSGLTVYEL